jgi:type II secretory pathway pseudopilin PulG
MFCNHCGREVPDSSTFCNNCGASLQTSAPNVPYPVVPPGGPTETVPTDSKATLSLIFGILSVTVFSFFAGIPAIILGHMSRSNIRKSMGRLKGEGMALAGLIMGYISLLAIPLILIIAAIAIPNLLRARQQANETSAISSMRTITVANATYQTEKGQGFAASLKELEDAGYIDHVLARGQKSGYRFSYSATDSDGDGTSDKFQITATPVRPGSSGGRIFCSDESGVIRQERAGQCTTESDVVD